MKRAADAQLMPPPQPPPRRRRRRATSVDPVVDAAIEYSAGVGMPALSSSVIAPQSGKGRRFYSRVNLPGVAASPQNGPPAAAQDAPPAAEQIDAMTRIQAQLEQQRAAEAQQLAMRPVGTPFSFDARDSDSDTETPEDRESKQRALDYLTK